MKVIIMREVSLKTIKSLTKEGIAVNVVEGGRIPKPYTKIAYSSGVNGTNGALYADESGKLYAICGRLQCLYEY